MLWKSILRTIRKSLGRYLAILAIIALGVGFFAGLRVTRDAICETANQYIEELNLFDFRLVSTLGFTEEDVAAFRELEGIESVQGSVSADLIYRREDGSDAVLHAHTLTEGINGVDILYGRLPQAPNECVLDARYADESRIGETICLSDSNSQDTFDTFAYREYTIVGLCNASAYINFERGSTALGNGSVSGYIYLPLEGFSVDYYTEIYLTLPPSGDMYSDQYQAAVDAMRVSVEDLLDRRAYARYDGIVSEAREAIDNAQAELEEKRQELKDAQAEIDRGWEALRNAEAALADSKRQLDDARTQLDNGWAALEAAKANSILTQDQLDAMEAELNKKEADYTAGLAAYEQAVRDAEEGFPEAEQELKDAQAEVDEALPQIEEAGGEIDNAMSDLDSVKPATVYTLDRSSNVGYASLENDTAIVSGVARVFPLFFFLVAALVCITTMTRMVGEMRTENGVLKALGYGNGAIIGQYLFYAGSASVVGCVAGFLVGSRFLPMALWQVYKIMYSIDRPVAFVLDFGLFALCSVLYLFCALGATWLVCHRDLRESAAQLIRPKAPAAGKRILLERVGWLWRHIKFLHKVSIRNILRYKKRMVMMIIGIGGCTALLLTGFGIRDSIQPVVTYQYSEIQLYDAAVSFMEPLDAEGQAAFSDAVAGVSQHVVYLHTGSVDLVTGDGSGSVNLVAFDSDLSDFVNLHDGKEPLPFPGPGEAVVDYRFAQEHGVSVGDTVELRDSGLTLAPVTVTVTGIFDNYIYDYIYVSADTLTAAWGEAPEKNTAYVNFAAGQDEKAAGAVLLGADGVATVMLSSDMETRVSSMLESLNYIVLIVLVCAGALAFIVLYNLTNITITERTREIATLKVLGFYQKEQHAYVFRENLVLTGISALCGIPMGIGLLHYVMAQIKISTMYFGCRLSPLSYLFAILITFIFTAVVDMALTAKIKHINMAEAMKAIE
ncbi:MAG: FtsX-like permease family protein [Eubacteriales bacterium]